MKSTIVDEIVERVVQLRAEGVSSHRIEQLIAAANYRYDAERGKETIQEIKDLIEDEDDEPERPRRRARS